MVAHTFNRDDGTFSPISTADLPGAGTAAFSAHKNGTDQTGVADATYTLITFGTEIYDIGGFFASNTWTPPAGKVHLSAAFQFVGTISPNALIAIGIFKNGSVFKQVSGNSLSGQGSVPISMDDDANGTDAYTARAFMNLDSGTGTINGATQETWFMGHALA